MKDMKSFLMHHAGLKTKEIKTIKDKKATTRAILDGLAWLVDGVQAGDRLFFHYSGHGAKLATLDPSGEPDGFDK